jgi:hypothetical protein
MDQLIFDYFEAMGFPVGEKYDIYLFDEILRKKEFIRACLRGVFDTDGSVFFDKRPIYRNHYPRIDLHLENKRLVKQVH